MAGRMLTMDLVLLAPGNENKCQSAAVENKPENTAGPSFTRDKNWLVALRSPGEGMSKNPKKRAR